MVPKRKRKTANQAGRPTLAELERRKARVMDAATALFIEHGYAATSLVDIAKAAGVATRTLYQHFGDKAEIFRAVINQRVAGAETRYKNLTSPRSLNDALVDAAHFICSLTFSGMAIPLLRLMVAESGRFPDMMSNIIQTVTERLHNALVEMFVALAERGQIPDGDHTITAKYFTDLILGSSSLRVAMNWRGATPSHAEIIAKVELFIAGRFGQAVVATAQKMPKTVPLTARKQA